MALPLPLPRLHLSEINDQPWFPPFLREHVQACLTLLWRLKLPLLQPISPASLVARTLRKTLTTSLRNYTFIDYCAGAGGPTPFIAEEVNDPPQGIQANGLANGSSSSAAGASDSAGSSAGIPFILTDLHPHIPAWTRAAALSPHIHYIPSAIDASASPRDLLSLAQPPLPSYGAVLAPPRKPFRLYNLAFHHFPDELAVAILGNTLRTAEGFAIFELQGRDVGNLVTVLLIGPLLWAGGWWWFWGEWGMLFWMYVVPVVPFVVVFDGVVSCLRTRGEGEVRGLIRRACEERGGEGKGGLGEGWRFEGGGEFHTWPMGSMRYFVGVKDRGESGSGRGAVT